MPMHISVLSGKSEAVARRFDQQRITIGRGADVDMRLNADEVICASGVHAHLEKQSRNWELHVDHRNGITLLEQAGPRFLEKGQSAVMPESVEAIIGKSGPRLRFRDERLPASVNGICIQIQTGAQAAKLLEFDQDTVTIGRSCRANVQLDPQRDLACASNIHAHLIRDGKHWQLEAVHGSGVVLYPPRGAARNVAPNERVAIEFPCEFTLGRSGPRLRVTSKVNSEDIPVTQAGAANGICGSMKVAVSDGLSRVLPICKRTPIRFVGLAALVILLSGVVLLRMNTFTHDDLRQHLTAARDSVYLVGHVRQDGTFAPGGTAWAVGKRMLATNAHVADLLQKFADNGMRTIARLPGTPPRDITINSITVHPGYRRLEPLMIANFQARGGEQRSMLPAFDVALLCVAEDAGRPLPLASDAEVRRIRGGEPVGYVGFPMENLMGMQGNQPPTIVTGGITAAHDALGQCAAERMNIVFQHNLQITGGSSGSPILNAAGQVVALNNAGHFAHVPGARISVGLNLAQRVDLLREMLEDRASSELVEHERYLVPQIRAAGANLADLVLARILRLVGEWLQSGELSERARPIPHPPWMETLREPARGRTFAVSLERGRHYVLVACAADFSSLKLELEVNGHIDESSEGLCPSIALRSAYQGPATIRVTSISGGNGTPRVLVQMAEIAN